MNASWQTRSVSAEVDAMAPDGSEIRFLAQLGGASAVPLGTQFQFRTTSVSPLTFVIATSPPWPRPDEAVPVAGVWQPVAQ
jgi:mannose-6-phosphate isomerase-like protein (cupin superfamily)